MTRETQERRQQGLETTCFPLKLPHDQILHLRGLRGPVNSSINSPLLDSSVHCPGDR